MPEPSILCVTVGRCRHRHLIAEHKHLAEQGCRLVELRLDFLVTPPNLKRLLAERPCPVIVTCRREQDGGRWAKSEEDRLMLIRQAINVWRNARIGWSRPDDVTHQVSVD